MSTANPSQSSGPLEPATRLLVPRQGGRRSRRVWAQVLSLLLIVAGALVALGASPAAAAPVYEITGRWAPNTPAQVGPGEVVTAEWRVNVNDDAPAPSNDPVDNVTVTLRATNGRFESIPEICQTNGVTPVSSISPDGTTLVCNLGTQNMGTAVALQIPVIADGETGDELSMSGEIGGQTADVSPIPIVVEFGMDITWASNDSLSGYYTTTGRPRLAILVCSGQRRGPGDWSHRTIWYAEPTLAAP